MRLYQLSEFEAKRNQPKSKTLFGCRENNIKTQGKKRERERERERERCELWKRAGARVREPLLEISISLTF